MKLFRLLKLRLPICEIFQLFRSLVHRYTKLFEPKVK